MNISNILKWLFLPITFPLLCMLFFGGVFVTAMGEILIFFFDELSETDPLPKGFVKWLEVRYA